MIDTGAGALRRSALYRTVNPAPQIGVPTSVRLPPRLIDRRSSTLVWGFLLLWTVAWAALQSVGGLYSWH